MLLFLLLFLLPLPKFLEVFAYVASTTTDCWLFCHWITMVDVVAAAIQSRVRAKPRISDSKQRIFWQLKGGRRYKHKFHFEIFWKQVCHMFCSGRTAQVTCDEIYSVYGVWASVTIMSRFVKCFIVLFCLYFIIENIPYPINSYLAFCWIVWLFCCGHLTWCTILCVLLDWNAHQKSKFSQSKVFARDLCLWNFWWEHGFATHDCNWLYLSQSHPQLYKTKLQSW